MPKSPRKGGEGQRSYYWTAKSYVKVLQHCMKYGSQHCLGILVGQPRSDGNLEIQDCIPVSHTHLLAPSAKIVFMLVEKYCSSLDQEILGIYVANAAAHDLEVPPVAKPLVEKISGGTCWVLDASKIEKGVPALTGYFPGTSGKFGNVEPGNVLVADNAMALNKKMTSVMKYLDIVDFDDHFTTPELDWLNPTFFQGFAEDSELEEVPE